MKSPRTIVRAMDDKLAEDSQAFTVAVVLVAAAQVGPNADRIAKRGRLTRAVARSWAKRARSAGVFQGPRIHHSGWFDKKSGGISFWLDVATVEGYLQRVP